MQQVNFVRLQSFRKIAFEAVDPCYRAEDRAHALHVTCKSQATRALWANLLYRANRIGPNEFRHWMRYHLNLPPLLYIGNGVEKEGYDYLVQKCLRTTCGDALITATRDHSASCLSAMSARSRLHRSIHDVFKLICVELAGSPQDPPQTRDVLGGEFSDLECSLLFPKNPTTDDSRFMKDMQTYIQSSRANTQLRQVVLGSCRKRAEKITDRKVTGRNLDLTFTLPLSNEEALIDASCLHSTCSSHFSGTNNWVRQVYAQQRCQPNPTPAQLTKRVDILDPSPPIKKRVALKQRTYACLMHMLKDQQQRHTRSHNPVLYPVVISHSGELCRETFNLVNKLGEEFFRQHKQAKPSDLSDPRILRGELRGRIKDHLLCANASGVGRLYAASGQFGTASTTRRRAAPPLPSHSSTPYVPSLISLPAPVTQVPRLTAAALATFSTLMLSIPTAS